MGFNSAFKKLNWFETIPNHSVRRRNSFAVCTEAVSLLSRLTVFLHFLFVCLLNISLPVYVRTVCLFVCFWRDSLQWARAFSFTRFLDYTQRRTTVGRTPLGRVISTSQRPLPDNTHNTHNRQQSMPPVGFEPTISAGERPLGPAREDCSACKFSDC